MNANVEKLDLAEIEAETERLIGRQELSILDRETHYSSEEIEERMYKMLDGVSGKDNEKVANAINKIKKESLSIIEDSKNKGILGNLINRFRNAKENFKSRTRELGEQIKDLGNMIETQNKEIEERIPQIEELLSMFGSIEKDIKSDISLANKIKEYLINTIAEKRLEMEKNPELANSYAFAVEIEQLETHLQVLEAKKDELNTKHGHYMALAKTTSTSLSVAKNLKQQYAALKTTVLPLWRSTAVTTTINSDLAEKIQFAKSMKTGVGEVFVENARQTSKNALDIASLQKEGILSIDNLKEVVAILEKSEKEREKIILSTQNEYKKREELNKQYLESLTKAKNNESLQILSKLDGKDDVMTSLEELKKNFK